MRCNASATLPRPQPLSSGSIALSKSSMVVCLVELRAVDEERRRLVHAELGPAVAQRDQLLEKLFVLLALAERLAREADLLAQGEELAEEFVGVGRRAHSSCRANSAETSGSDFSPPAQRAVIDARASFSFRRNSRNTRRTLPVSMYFSLSVGSTLVWKLAQAGHVMEAYSTIVTGASGEPIARSGIGPGFRRSSGGSFVPLGRGRPLDAVCVLVLAVQLQASTPVQTRRRPAAACAGTGTAQG